MGRDFKIWEIVLLFAILISSGCSTYSGYFNEDAAHQTGTVLALEKKNHKTETPSPSPSQERIILSNTNTLTPSPSFFIKVNADRVNLREGPGKEFEVKDVALWGQEFPVYQSDSSKNWLKIHPIDEIWIYAAYTIIVNEITPSSFSFAENTSTSLPTKQSPTRTKTPTFQKTSTSTKSPPPTPKRPTHSPTPSYKGLGVKLGPVRSYFEDFGLNFETTISEKGEHRIVSTVDQGETFFISFDSTSSSDNSYITNAVMFVTVPTSKAELDSITTSFYYMSMFIDNIAPSWTNYDDWITKTIKKGVDNYYLGNSDYEASTTFPNGVVEFKWTYDLGMMYLQINP